MSFVELLHQTLNTTEVGIVEFAEEMCGKGLYPRQQVLLKLIFLEEMEGWEEDVLTEWLSEGGEALLSPQTRERREYLREQGYNHFPEIVLVGGRRSSKGYVSGIALGKVLFETWKLGDPGGHYGIDIDKEIYFSCVASSLDQAKKYQFQDLTSTITRCRPLIESNFGLGKVQELAFSVHTAADKNMVAELKRRGIPVGRNFAKLRGQPLAANADSIRGSATMGIIFDEMAFMEQTEGNRSSADECYAAAEPSLAQFGKDGILFMNSSPYTKVGIFYEKFIQSMKIAKKTNKPEFPDIFALQFPSWELFKDYSRKKFPKKHALAGKNIYQKALMVSPDWDPETLPEDDAALCRRERLREQSNPDKYRVERRAQWAEVQEAYLRPEAVDAAFAIEFRGKPIFMRQMGTYIHQPYVMHVDPSSTTAGFGMSIAHLETFNNPETKEDEQHVVFDMVYRWDPKNFEDETIDYIAVCKDILHYCMMFRPKTLTMDQWNSVAPTQWLMQKLKEHNLPTRVSVEHATKSKNWNRWELFKTALYTGRVHIPYNCIDEKGFNHSEYAGLELKFLQVKLGSVEKQEIGPVQTKDIADTIAECVRTLMSNVLGYDQDTFVDMAMGAQGGYPIGGSHPMQQQINSVTDYMKNARIMPAPTRGMGYREQRSRGGGRGRGY